MLGDHVLFDGLSVHKKGDNGPIRWSMDIQMPGLSGILDTRILGGVMASEMIDLIRWNWSHGRSATGAQRFANYRKYEKDSQGRSVMRSKEQRKYDQREFHFKVIYNNYHVDTKTQKAIEKNYSYTSRGFETQIDGTKIRTVKKNFYTPQNPDRNYTPLHNSGKMLNSLTGSYRSGRRRFMRGSADMMDYSEIRIGVTKDRQKTAYFRGGLSNVDSSFENYMQRNIGYFQKSKTLVENAIAWNDKTKGLNAVLITAAIVRALVSTALKGVSL